MNWRVASRFVLFVLGLRRWEEVRPRRDLLGEAFMLEREHTHYTFNETGQVASVRRYATDEGKRFDEMFRGQAPPETKPALLVTDDPEFKMFEGGDAARKQSMISPGGLDIHLHGAPSDDVLATTRDEAYRNGGLSSYERLIRHAESVLQGSFDGVTWVRAHTRDSFRFYRYIAR